MPEGLRIALQIAGGLTPIALALWGAIWFLVKALVFNPLTEIAIEQRKIAIEQRKLNESFIRLETNHEARLANVERQVSDLSDRLSE